MLHLRIKEFLENVVIQIKHKPIRNDISEELKSHIEEIKDEYLEEGYAEKEAEEKAISQMGDAEDIGKKLNKIHRPRLDWKMLIIICILLAFGFLVTFVRAGNHIYVMNGSELPLGIITKYIVFVILGFLCGICIYFMDYRKMYKYSNYIYIMASLSIILSLFFGAPRNGVRHLHLFGITFSVTMIATLLYTIAFVGFIQKINSKSKLMYKFSQNRNLQFNVIKIIILSLVSIFLLIQIPSSSSAFILGLVYLIIATVKISKLQKNKMKYISLLWGIPIVLGIICVVCLLGSLGSGFRINRLIASFYPEIDPDGSGWVGINQRLIVNSAKLYGEADDMSNALYYFDEGTNYAFISILAHYGWIISFSIVAIIILLSIRLIMNSIKIKDMYGKLLVISIASIFILQSVLNILMNLGLGIHSDFNLPLISYGGANLIINMMSLAVVLSVYRRKDIIQFSKAPNEEINYLLIVEKLLKVVNKQ